MRSSSKITYRIGLSYEAYFGKTMEIQAGTLLEACRSAMEFADGDSDWRDTLLCSTHWIDSVDHDPDMVPVECSAAAIRCGGAVLIADRLREALICLVRACEQHIGTSSAIRRELEGVKAVLMEVPDRIGD